MPALHVFGASSTHVERRVYVLPAIRWTARRNVHSSREIEPSNGKVVVLYSSVETAGMVICVVITCEVVEGGAGVRTSCLPFGE